MGAATSSLAGNIRMESFEAYFNRYEEQITRFIRLNPFTFLEREHEDEDMDESEETDDEDVEDNGQQGNAERPVNPEPPSNFHDETPEFFEWLEFYLNRQEDNQENE